MGLEEIYAYTRYIMQRLPDDWGDQKTFPHPYQHSPLNYPVVKEMQKKKLAALKRELETPCR